MGNQRTFASMAWQAKGKVTRRERFLAEMDAVIPCQVSERKMKLLKEAEYMAATGLILTPANDFALRAGSI